MAKKAKAQQQLVCVCVSLFFNAARARDLEVWPRQFATGFVTRERLTSEPSWLLNYPLGPKQVDPDLDAESASFLSG